MTRQQGIAGVHKRRANRPEEVLPPGHHLLSRLKEWKVTRMSGGKIGIQCPHKDCEGKAVVNAKKWYGSRPQFGRSCTYCFRTNKIPQED